jgi:hypothetical protein
VRRLSRISIFIGFDPRRCFKNIKGIPSFIRDWIAYDRRSADHRFRVRIRDLFPILDERGEAAGIAGGHYFHQDLWAARKIYQHRPERHIDVGSRIDGFIAHLLPFVPVTVIDVRPIASTITGLSFIQDDATLLRNFADRSVTSISSLHAAEHFGLGRYSDPIDPNACFRFMAALQRVLEPNGRLYFSVPIGRERVDFNAHRVFAPETILSVFSQLKLLSFSYVDDGGNLHEDANPMNLPELEYGCGLFELTNAVPGTTELGWSN